MSTEAKPRLVALLTVEQCAELLQCSASQVERFVHAGLLRRVVLSMREVGKGQRGPKGWRIHPDALRDFIESRSSYETPPKAEASTPQPSARTPQLPMATGRDGKTRARIPKNPLPSA
jgi:hypothetical protein